MREYLKFYIDGKWVDPVEPKTLDVDNPTTEQVSGKKRPTDGRPMSDRPHRTQRARGRKDCREE